MDDYRRNDLRKCGLVNNGMDRRSRFSGVGRRPAIDSDVDLASWFGRDAVEGTMGPASESELESDESDDDEDDDDEQNRAKQLP